MKKPIQYFNNTIFRRAAVFASTLALDMEVNQAMKTMRNLLLAGLIPLFCCSIGNAQIIYSNAFNGGASGINRFVPQVSTNDAGGISGPHWNSLSNSATSFLHQDGTVGTGMTTSLMPFTPENGYVYTLSASVTVPTMTAGKWITMGFAEYNPLLNTASDPRFGSTQVSGNPWTYLTEGTGGCFFYPLRGTTTGNANLMPTAGTYTVQLKLDTTGSSWKASEFVNGTQIGTTYTYSTNPDITGIGVGQTALSSSTGIKWNYLALEATGTRSTSTVNATVSFSGTGWHFYPGFVGMSYEKLQMTNANYFSSNNLPLVNLLSLMGPLVLRIGGGTVDTTGWNGISNTIPITAAQVDRLAGFINALPGNVSVIYGINYLHNTADNVEGEAVYAHQALGSRLLGFEIGNEPEFYPNFSYSAFRGHWRILAAAITNHVPGWAVTNGGNGWILDGADAGQGQLSAITDPFASDESGVASLLTQHYYRGTGGQPVNTMQTMLTADPFLHTLSTNIVGAALGHCANGSRISECASFSAGGTLDVSDVYGAALWSLDFMGTAAQNGVQGVNFHGGGKSPYSPITDDGVGNVTAVHGEFYGMGMFSMIPTGYAVPATITGASGINFTAYGVNCTSGGRSALLINKEVNDTVNAAVSLGSGVASVAMITLTSPNLYCTNGYTLGGAPINLDGSWAGAVQSVLSAPSGQVTVGVPPISAVLLIPITVGSKPAVVTSGPIFNLREDLTTGPADYSYHWGSSTDTNFLMGDWDGDGTWSPGVVRINTSGQWEWLLHNKNDGGGADYDFAYGTALPGDVLVVGDWDGNGTMTPGIIRTNSVGQWTWNLRNSNAGGGADIVYTYGRADGGGIPIVGDWDGNGTFTPGIVSTNTSSQWTWNLRNSNNGGGADIVYTYGGYVSGDIPITGDWDGNGTFTPGIVRGNTWLLRNSNNGGGADITFGYGSAGDTFLIWQ